MTSPPRYRSLHDYLEREGCTQEQVAAKLGVRQGHISNLLHRKRSVSLAFAFHVQRVLGVDAASFILTDEERERTRRGLTNTTPAD